MLDTTSTTLFLDLDGCNIYCKTACAKTCAICACNRCCIRIDIATAFVPCHGLCEIRNPELRRGAQVSSHQCCRRKREKHAHGEEHVSQADMKRLQARPPGLQFPTASTAHKGSICLELDALVQ